MVILNCTLNKSAHIAELVPGQRGAVRAHSTHFQIQDPSPNPAAAGMISLSEFRVNSGVGAELVKRKKNK